MPDVVTHLYDPAIGVCPNICSLNDFEALRVLDQLRRKFRPTLKPNYLARRRGDSKPWSVLVRSHISLLLVRKTGNGDHPRHRSDRFG
jgi:hypothetical protein